MKTITDYLTKHKSVVVQIGKYQIQFELKGRFLSMEFNNERYVCNAYDPGICGRIQSIFEDTTKQEIRFCDECGKPIDYGYTMDDGSWYCCEDCFEPAMDKDYGKENWRVTDEIGEWGGYYEALKDGEWEDTGIYYTEWY